MELSELEWHPASLVWLCSFVFLSQRRQSVSELTSQDLRPRIQFNPFYLSSLFRFPCLSEQFMNLPTPDSNNFSICLSSPPPLGSPFIRSSEFPAPLGCCSPRPFAMRFFFPPTVVESGFDPLGALRSPSPTQKLRWNRGAAKGSAQCARPLREIDRPAPTSDCERFGGRGEGGENARYLRGRPVGRAAGGCGKRFVESSRLRALIAEVHPGMALATRELRYLRKQEGEGADDNSWNASFGIRVKQMRESRNIAYPSKRPRDDGFGD
jgi:hypothetical protein